MKRTNSDVSKSKYKAISNLVRSKTRQDTADYISTLSMQLLLCQCKEILELCQFSEEDLSTPPSLNHSGAFISDDTEKASILNEYIFQFGFYY